MFPSGRSRKPSLTAILAERVAKHGPPSLDHYRRVYAACDLDWPGDEEIRRLYPAAHAALSR